MATDNKAQIEIGAKIDQAVSAVAELQGQFEHFAKDVQSKFSDVTGASDKLLGRVKSLVEAFVSFAAVKKSVDTTKDLGVEALKVASIFGTTQAEASQFAVALGDVQSNTEQATQAAAFLSRQVRQNEDALNRVGIATRDSNGNLKDQKTLFLDSIAAINAHKAGTDRNAASIIAFGRGALEMQDILRLTPEVMEAARKKADELGLTLTEQGAKTVQEYRNSMSDAADVLKAFEKVVGEAVMPVLTEVGNWFAGQGHDAVVGFSVVIKSLASVFGVIVTSLEVAVTDLKAFMQTIVIGLATLVDAVASKSPTKAKEMFSRGWEQVKDVWKQADKDVDAAGERMRKRLQDMWAPSNAPAGGTGGGTRRFSPIDPNLPGKLEAHLAQLKAIWDHHAGDAGQANRFTLDQEAEYWKNVLDRTDLSLAQRLAIQMKYWGLEAQIRARNFTARIVGLQSEQALYQKDLDTRLAYAQRIAAAMAAEFGPNSPEAQAAIKGVNDVKRQIEARAHEIEMIWVNAASQTTQSVIAMARSSLDLQRQLGIISHADELSRSEALLDQEFEAKRVAIERELAYEQEQKEKHADWDLTKTNELNAKLQSLEEERQAKKLELEKAEILEAHKYAMQAQQGVQQAFTSAFEDLLKMDQSFSQIAKNFGRNLLNAITNAIAAAAAQRIVMNLGINQGIDAMMSAIGFGGGAATSTAMTTAATALTTAGGGLTTAAGGLGASAASLAASATLLAQAAALQMASSGGGGVVAFAQAGFDVPAGVNPVTQLHQREMVLPAHLADTVRSMAAGGSPGGGVHFHNHAGIVVTERELGAYISRVIRHQMRNFNPNLGLAAGRG